MQCIRRNIRGRYIFPILLPVLLGCFCQDSPAQEPLTAIQGVVRNQTGEPIAGASLIVNSPAGERLQSVQSDSQGHFAIPLAPGMYDLEVSRQGYATQQRARIEVRGSQPLALEFVLERGATETQAERIGEMQLVGLPLNGRSYNQLATLQAGVADTSAQDSSRGVGGGSITVAGGRPTSNNFLLDGTNIMDISNQVPRSAAGVQLGSEAVLQVQVFSMNSGAEYGRGSGGTMNSITRSGGNQFHGTLFEYFRNSKMDARNFFDGAEPPPFKRNQFGFLLTGPIRKDHTFFMGTFEAMRDRLTRTETDFLPDANAHNGIITDASGNVLRTVPVHPKVPPYLALYPLPNLGSIGGGLGRNAASVFLPTSENYFAVRVDHKFSDKDSFFARYTFDDATSTSPQELYLFRTFTSTRQQYLTIVESHIFSIRTLHSLRLGYTRPTGSSDSLSSIEIPRSLYFVPGSPHFGLIDIPGIPAFGPNETHPEKRQTNSFQFADDVVLQRGAHGLKFGSEIHRYRWDLVNSTAKSGMWDFNSLESFLQGGPEGTELIVALPGSDNKKAFRLTLAGFYLQDSYRVRSGLRLDLGLRYEIASLIREKDGRITILPDRLRETTWGKGPMLRNNPSLLNFSPRLGFSGSLKRFGNLLVSGGFGVYYDPLLEYPADPQKHTAPYYKRAINPNFDSSGVFPDALAGAALTPFGSPFGVAILDYDHMRNPQVLRYNLTLQHSLPAGGNLRMSYVGARGNHLFRGYESNLYPPATSRPDDSLYLPPNAGPLNPAFGLIGVVSSDAQSFYNAFQIAANLSPRRGLSAQANYTFSKSVDDASQSSSGAPENYTRQYPFRRTLDRGLSQFDIRQRLTLNYFYTIPLGNQQRWFKSGLLAHLLGAWRVGGVFSFRTGTPSHPLVNIRTPGYLFAANRPN
ncbi:MAG: TonB-dependent receptor, partial [Acidobacteria bacterium]|nr:TonB-dependent receptor [Acidobacteriota bacterium]